MNYRVESSIFESFPDFCRGVVVASKVDNAATTNPELEGRFREVIRGIEADPSISEDHVRIMAWSEIYRKFPVPDARKIRPSVGSLVRRIKNRGKELPFISPLVCISNLVSLTHLTPSGLVDAEKVTGDLVLGYALGTESFVSIGADEVTSPEVGEIVYYDSGSRKILCRAWNSRGGKSALTSPATRTAVIDVDGLLNVMPREELERATNTVAELVKDCCSATTSIHFLSQDQQSIRVVVE